MEAVCILEFKDRAAETGSFRAVVDGGDAIDMICIYDPFIAHLYMPASLRATTNIQLCLGTYTYSKGSRLEVPVSCQEVEPSHRPLRWTCVHGVNPKK